MVWIPQDETQTELKKKEDVGSFESALAGIATGIWNIPKGFVSLGAELYDLTGDTNKAKEVEKWFDDVNPFDDEAEAKTAGKITQAISQIAPLAVTGAVKGATLGFQVSRNLAKKAIEAKRLGKNFNLYNVGRKISGAKSGTVIGAGLGSAVVTDEDIGTLADMTRGTSLEPFAITMLNIEEKEGREEAYRRLLNRIKFGTESALFDLALIGTGRVINKLRTPSELPTLEYSESPLQRIIQKYIVGGFKPEGLGTKSTLESYQTSAGAIKASEFAASKAAKEFDDSLKDVWSNLQDQYLIADKSIQIPEAAKRKALEDVYQILRPAKGQDTLLKSEAKQRAITELAETKLITKPKTIFSIDDYKVTDKLNSFLEKVKKAGGDVERVKNSILNFRLSIDNMSGRLLQGQLPKEISDSIKDKLGSYFTSEYYQFNRLNPLKKYKPVREQIERSVDLLLADKEKSYLQKSGGEPLSVAERNRLKSQAEREVNFFLKKKSIDEVEFKDLNKQTANEIENIKINPSILKEKVLKPWQEEIAGIIKNPVYAFISTIGKQSHLNYSLKYMDDIANIGSKKGKGKFIFNADELSEADKINPLKFKLVKPTSQEITGLSNLEGKYVSAPMYDAIFDVTSNWLNRGSPGTLYKYAILAPKAASQIAKTILSPITHVRNFITAGAFAAANGALLPSYGDIKLLAPKSLGGKGLLETAYGLTGKRILGTSTKADDELYERLLKVGVVDSQVQVNEHKRLIKDIITDPSENKIELALGNVGKKITKGFGKIQDAYVAEDDFWKIINWNLERNRYDGIFNKLGINSSNYLKILGEDSKLSKFLREMTPRQEYAAQSYDNFLDEVAGNLVRNQVPNYGYIGRSAKALRLSPFGNFISFPLEIIRTGNNIYSQAIKEITSGVPEIRDIGLRRLFSFGLTVGGIPYATSELFKSLNNVSDEELLAIRKFVPEWSKNSTLLITGRNEKGYPKYIDFSYSNPYDTLIRPFNAILNEIGNSQVTKESLMKKLGDGIVEGAYDLLQPFMSESIFTEALVDSTLRRGIGRGGKRIWSPEDDGIVKVIKGISHIAESFKPGSIDQFKRLNDIFKGKTEEKYGELYKLKDELPGIFGFRSIQINPERSLDYMTSKFNKNLNEDRNLFSSPLLRGGRVNPEDIINRYEYSESRRFQTMKEMYSNIDAARKIGVQDNIIKKKLESRKGMDKDVIKNIMKGKYLPDLPNDFFVKRIREINNDLNAKEGVDTPNPYFIAVPKIRELYRKNKQLNLITDEMKVSLPSFEEGESLGQGVVIPSPTVPGSPPPIVSSVAPQQNTSQQYASLFPNDVLGQAIANKPIQIVG